MKSVKRQKQRFWDLSKGRPLSVLRRIQKYFPEVENIADATASIEIEVTSKDSSKMGEKNHALCALARACRRSEHLDGAVISRTRAFLVKDGVATRYNLPERATREIISFDRGGSFNVGTYQLQKPTPSDLRSKRHPKPKRKNTGIKHSAKQITQNVRTSFSSEKE